MDMSPGAWLVGVDPVPAFVAHARSFLPSRQAGFVVGVAERLPFRDGAFDCCLSLLVLQELGNRGGALAEMGRVIRRGGVVAACQWDFAGGMPIVAALRTVLEGVAPEAYRQASSGPARPFASEAELREHWEVAGLTDAETARLVVVLPYDSFADLWRSLSSGSTPMLALLAALPLPAREVVRTQLSLQLAGGRDDRPF
jgi:ubiquinone/menaquinone biosynthesis C-methylase UbiE